MELDIINDSQKSTAKSESLIRTASLPLISYKGQDKLALFFLRFCALAIFAILVLMIGLLFKMAMPAISMFGLEFITSSDWNPVEDQFGGLAFIYGTVTTSFLALIIATPLSIAMAIFISQLLKGALSKVVSMIVELIAAVPSIVFGLWGLFYLAPWVKSTLTPFLKNTLGFLPQFQGPSFGIGILSASIILAIMITPTITSIVREIFNSVPQIRKEAALGLGATKYEMIRIAVLRPSLSGILGAVVLGLGRALGETMAVAMIIGNNPTISKSLFSPGATMASVIANEYAEAEGDLHLSALCYIALILFAITFIVNLAARTIIWHNNRRSQK